MSPFVLYIIQQRPDFLLTIRADDLRSTLVDLSSQPWFAPCVALSKTTGCPQATEHTVIIPPGSELMSGKQNTRKTGEANEPKCV